MNNFRHNVAFVEPTFLSGCLVAFGAVLVLLAANASFLIKSGLLYDTLIGQDSSYQYIQSSYSSSETFSSITLGEPIVDKIFYFGFWFFVGLLIYATFSSFSLVVGEASRDVAELHYVNARKEFIAKRVFLRLVMRTSAIVGLLMFSWVMVRLLLPFCVLAVRVAFSEWGLAGWLWCIMSFLVMVLSLHLYVILLRLLVMRPRVFES